MYAFLLRRLSPAMAGALTALWYGVLILLVVLCAVAPRGSFSYLRL